MNNRYFTIKLCATLVFVFTSVSCSPWRFQLQRAEDYPIEGRILSAEDSVTVDADNAIALAHPARIAFRSEQITDGEFDTELLLKRGSGFALVFRSTPYDDSASGGPSALRLHIGREISSLTGRGIATSAEAPLPSNKPFRVVVVQHGRWIDVEVACVKIRRFAVETPSTQWITLEPDPDSRVELRDPQFRSLGDVYETIGEY